MLNLHKRKRLLIVLCCLSVGSMFGALKHAAIAQSDRPLYLWNIVRYYSGQPQQDNAIRILQTQIDQNSPEILAADSVVSHIWRDSQAFAGHQDIFEQIPTDARTGSDPLEMALAIAAPRLGAPLDIQVLPVGNIESPDRVIITVDRGGFLDDSVAGSRQRFDIQQQNDQWTILRAGIQYRCQPGRGQQIFAVDLCI